jgi:hypothetical protein
MRITALGYSKGLYTPGRLGDGWNNWTGNTFSHAPGYIALNAVGPWIMLAPGQGTICGFGLQDKALADILLDSLETTCQNGDPHGLVGGATNI